MFLFLIIACMPAPDDSPAQGATSEPPVPITVGLVRRASDGDASAWDQLYRRSFRAVFRQEAGEFKPGDVMSGRYLVEDGLVASACELRA